MDFLTQAGDSLSGGGFILEEFEAMLASAEADVRETTEAVEEGPLVEAASRSSFVLGDLSSVATTLLDRQPSLSFSLSDQSMSSLFSDLSF